MADFQESINSTRDQMRAALENAKNYTDKANLQFFENTQREMLKQVQNFSQSAIGTTQSAFEFVGETTERIATIAEDIADTLDDLNTVLDDISKLGKKVTDFPPKPLTSKVKKISIEKKIKVEGEGRKKAPERKGAGKNPNFLILKIKKYNDLNKTYVTVDWTELLPNDIKKEYQDKGVFDDLKYLCVGKPPDVSFTNNYDNYLQSFLEKVKSGTAGRLLDVLATANIITSSISDLLEKHGTNVVEENIKQAIKVSQLPPGTRYTNIYSNIQNWASTSALKLGGGITIDFYFGQLGLFDGRLEVWNPAIFLTSLFLPEAYSPVAVRGVLPDSKTFKTQILMGLLDTAATKAFDALGSKNKKKLLNNLKENAKIKQEQEETQQNTNPSTTQQNTGSPTTTNQLTSSSNDSKKVEDVEDKESISSKIEGVLEGLMDMVVKNIKNVYSAWGGLYVLEFGTTKDSGGKAITLFKFEDFIIKNVSLGFDGGVDENGFPIHARVTLNEVESIAMAHKAVNNAELAESSYFRLFTSPVTTTGIPGRYIDEKIIGDKKYQIVTEIK